MVTMIRSDLDFILAQIKIAEAEVAGQPVLGNLIPNSELPWGLRHVDGSNNNLLAGQENYGAADQPFPEAVAPKFINEGDDGMRFGPPNTIGNIPLSQGGVPVPYGFLRNPDLPFDADTNPRLPDGYIPQYALFQGKGLTATTDGFLSPNGQFIPSNFQPNYLVNNNYATNTNGVPGVDTANDPSITNSRAIQPGDVVDADPRVISNLIADQTLKNPAVVFKALQVAGVADPFQLTQAISTAVTDVLNARAAVTVAERALATAASNAGSVSVTAYLNATNVANQLGTLAQAVDASTSALKNSLDLNAPAADANDAATLDQARADVAQLLATATQIQTVLTAPGVFANPVDLGALTDIIELVTLMQGDLQAINVVDGTASLADRSRANSAELDGNSIDDLASSFSAQLSASLSSLNTNVGAAQAALSQAGALEVSKTGALQNLIAPIPFLTEASPTGDILKTTLVVENVAPDAGLSTPFNGWMTLFGQFFDHGLDLVAKGGFGTVYVPLQPDDPLYRPGSSTNFMALTRSTLDADGNAINKVTPFVDQNQTYTSNPSAQVFHREYVLRDGKPVATGKLLNDQEGGLATWADIKAQAKNILGIELGDMNIHDIPEIVVDAYGNFIPGSNGYPQLVRSIAPNGTVTAETATVANGIITSTVKTYGPNGEVQFVSTGHAFLDDIAHAANPAANLTADTDTELGLRNADSSSTVGEYDNELLDRHFVTGDGRGNENIGLTAVHHVFHSEHNRQVALIKELVLGEAKSAVVGSADAAEKLAFLNEWLATDLTAAGLATATVDNVAWHGERLFQAAKFPTEMQYQHLVFEEFARTVQPFVNVFNDYDGQLNPAIFAEFAHVVYRFGHSMLTETVDRFDVNNKVVGSGGSTLPGEEQIGLIEAFLNPVEFYAGGFNADQAAGAIARGMTRQVGNEIDEFITEALRNNLVGLPLDLAAINIARGRETGVPTLNAARADFYAGSQDSQVRPYTSWADFAANLKNPASVINFIAAYGTHSSVVSASTLAAKREAATKLVLGGEGAPADRMDFLHAKGAFAGGVLGGLNLVDFWIGGLAEKQMAFGGMLGTTFNFVFEVQMEHLQNGDRFYYLSRLANLNLTAQLENNKFADIIHRNTDATHLPGNVFKAMDYQLEVNQAKQYNAGLGTADPEGATNGLDPFLGALNGDKKVIRETIVDSAGNLLYNKLQFVGGEHVVLGGTNQADWLIGDEGDDTFWGDGGDDRIEGGIGNDFIFGGDGNDIITDQFGDDEIRSGAGDDVVSGGQGLNLIITDTGNDFVWAGNDDDEMLLGQGNDFGAGGEGSDFIIGGEGNDWVESGPENGLMLGDNGDIVQGLPIKRSVDSPLVGHDVLVATGGNADFDAETGDDIMVGGLGTDRFFGQFGFDWATYKNDPTGIEADMSNRLFAPPSIAGSPGAILDRYAQTEALSGSRHTDFLRGDDETDLSAGGGAVTANGLTVAVPPDHALKDSNVDLIEGLSEFLGSINEAGENRFSTGNILLGGDGSDVIEGRGGDDVIGGDQWLDVQIKVNQPDGTFFVVNGMKDIQERMFSGEIKVSQLEILRSLKTADGATDIDVAQFSGARADYAVEGMQNLITGEAIGGAAGDANNDGFISVVHLSRGPDGVVQIGTIGSDGSDKLKSVERLLFSDQTIEITGQTFNTIASGAVVVTSNPAGALVGSVLTANLSGIVDLDGLPVFVDNPATPNVNEAQIDRFTVFWQFEEAPGVWTNLTRVVADEFAPVTGLTLPITDAETGLSLRALVRFKDGDGVVEQIASNVVGSGTGVVGAPVIPDPAAELGLNLAGVAVDGEVLPTPTLGILEDLAPTPTTAPGTPFTFTAAQLLTNIQAANPGQTISIVSGPTGIPLVTVRTIDGGAAGTLNFSQTTNLFTFIPAPNFNGAATFEFEVDVLGAAATPFAAEAVLDVIAVNDAPLAPTNAGNLGSVPAVAGGTFTFTEAQLIGNAFDVDGDNLRIFRPDAPDGGVRPPSVVADLPAGAPATAVAGTVTENADGTFTYTAADGYIGPVILRYQITDGLASVEAVAGIVSANGAPVVSPLARVATEDAFAGVNLALGAVDPEGAALTVSGAPATITTTNLVQLVSGTDFTVTAGVFQVTAAGVAKFQSLAQGQTDSFIFSYQLSDGVTAVTTSLSVTVNGLNDGPTAAAETVITNVALGTAFTLPDWALLANDVDPDAGTVLAVTTRGTATGVTLGAGGSVTDTAAAGGSFTYTASDGTLTSNATVTVQTGATTTSTFADNFDTPAASNSTGTAAWTSSWVETDDVANSIANGQIQLDVVNSNQLRFLGGDGASIARTINLAGATSASLSFDFIRNPNILNNLDPGEALTVQFSADGVTFTDIGVINGASGVGPTGAGTFTAALPNAAAFSANSAIRLVTSAITVGGLFTEAIYVNDLSVSVTRPAATITGTAGSQVLVGDGSASTFDGGAGNDVILAGGGDDVITQTMGQGRDLVDGGTNGTVGDTFVINGDATAETFGIYTRDAFYLANPTLSQTAILADTQIVITRNGSGAASVVAELRNIEELVINTVPQTAGGLPVNGAAGGDTIQVFGNFTGVLNPNTITINGTAAADTVDISALASAHRIVFRSNGGNDTLVGTLRPQDVIELPSGTPADYTMTVNANGSRTLSNGTSSVTFTSTGTPMVVPPGTADGVTVGAFTLTQADIAGLKALVNGQALPGGGDDEVPTGVRTLSGEGNNVDNPEYGAADTPFIRLTDARYGANGSVNPIFDGLDPRTISNIIGTQEPNLPKQAGDANIFFMAFGQYVDHGLDFIPKGGNGSIAIGTGAEEGVADLTRASVSGVVDRVPQHLNKTSNFIDQNQAYGSNEFVGKFLREPIGNGEVGSRLAFGDPDPSNPVFDLLPTLRQLLDAHIANGTKFGNETILQKYPQIKDIGGSYNPTVVKTLAGDFFGKGQPLLLDSNPTVSLLDHIVAGDGRANENVSLTAVHTIWARNHNFHVENLLAQGFQGTPEDLFQAAKMINEAEYQRVVLTEFTDKLLGGLQGDGTHGHNGYNPDADPGISHEFAAAAYRFGHSLVAQDLTIAGQQTPMPLFDAFLNPAGYEQLGASAILGGVVTQPAEEVDANIVNAIRNDLVRIRADLFAFNVARGRDVGLGTLNQVRQMLAVSTDPYVREALSFAGNLDPYASWDDFQQRNNLSDAVIAQFKQAYPDLVLSTREAKAAFQVANPDITLVNGNTVRGIDRVDLWVGGLTEKHINNGMVGQTFWVILHEQFDRLQEADRFYYTDRFDNFDFYENHIDGQSFAEIVARNTGLTLGEDIFSADAEDGANDGGGDDAGDGDGDTGGGIGDGGTGGDDEDDDAGAGAGNGSGSGSGTGTGNGTGTPAVIAAITNLGTPGVDMVVGNAGDDALGGDASDDTIFGRGGNDSIAAGTGNDQVFDDQGNNVVAANAGNDRVITGSGNDILTGGEGDDVLYSGGGNDMIFGDEGRDVIDAGDGNDIIFATKADGSDVIEGGLGFDTIDYSQITTNLVVDMSGSVGYAKTGTEEDSLSGIEKVRGGLGHDTFIAGDAANIFEGGAGFDTFEFRTAASAKGDTINGFQTGDKIKLAFIDKDDASVIGSNAGFTAVGQLKINVVGADTVLEGNTDSDAAADFSITISGRTDITTADLDFTKVA